MATKQSRSKTGCLTCKTRRKKCDEQRPTCERCSRAKMECLGYSYLDNPEELAQARAKIAASRITRVSEQPNSPLGMAGPSQFAAWRGHPVPVRSGSAPSDMTASGVPGHDFVRDASHSESDTTQLDVMEFPFLSQSSAPDALDSPHAHSNSWWGAGSGAAMDGSGVGQSFTGQGVTSISGHHSTPVEFHQPRHSEDSQLFLSGGISHPNYTISGVNPLRRSRSETARYSIEDSLYDHDSDSTDDSDHENITGIMCGVDPHSNDGNDVLPFILQSSMDVMTSLGTGCPMSFQYDVTYSDPVLGASGVFDAADALGLQWMYGCPEFFIILLARMHNIRDDTTRRVDAQEVGEIEQSIRGWQPRYPLSQDPHLAVARLAVQECWRQILLVYIFMGICKTTSEDPRVKTAHKSFMKLIKTIQPRRIPDLFLLLPFFVVSVASSHTEDRNKIYGRMRGIRECRISGTAGSDLVDMVLCIHAQWLKRSLSHKLEYYTMAELPVSQIAHFSELHPKPDRYKFSYGTAGFRTAADTLDSVLFRVGVIASLRSKRLDGKTIGVMVTASHNPEHDNGVKLVDPRGEMLEAAWEGYATALANAATTEEFIEGCNHLVTSLKIDVSKPAYVLYARDTRPSGPTLIKALEDGIAAVGATGRNEGVQATPIVHYLATKQAPSPLVVDCANGVGYLAIQQFAPYVEDILKFIPINTAIDTEGALNNQAGADYVKTQQRMPPSVAENLKILQRACSFDGDADRLIYYYVDEQRQFRLLDGDKIAALVAGFFADTVKAAGLAGKIEVGIVQTAYANGNSTKYLSSRLPVKCTPTGVKHLHHAAQRFGIGVYFEANGHGTVLFSHQTLELLDNHQPGTPSNASHLNTLRNLRDLINQTVGDALSDLLLCEVVLAHRLYTPVEWDSLYADLPNRLLKVQVRDRSIFTTEDAERRLATPVGLQKMIDDTVRKYESGRSFVRPSGTEDVVRIYAECSNMAQVDELANRVARLVYEHGEVDQFGRTRETY
ncbi:unnamed protein product [Rhizoctonia solani]|nr:unnamed protein product [Rhizoctonia solani]